MTILARVCGENFMLGPHWCMLYCTYLVVIGVSVIIYGLVLTSRQDIERIIGLTLTILCILALTVLAVKDPGVVPNSSEPVGELSTFCEKCDSYRPHGAIHCNDCQVCIEEYDHHCPWSSKCIGKKNVLWFHVFLSILFILMVYNAVETILVLAAGTR